MLGLNIWFPSGLLAGKTIESPNLKQSLLYWLPRGNKHTQKLPVKYIIIQPLVSLIRERKIIDFKDVVT